MKQKLSPGVVMDFVSPEEVMSIVTDRNEALLRALGKNARFVRAIASGQSDANGNFNINIGPDTGFLWSIRWVNWSGLTGNMSMYLNTIQNMSLLGADFPAGTAAQYFSKEGIIIRNPDVLVFTQGTSVSDKSTQISVQVFVLEVPFSHESQLF